LGYDNHAERHRYSEGLRTYLLEYFHLLLEVFIVLLKLGQLVLQLQRGKSN
jgi:hypothetical protein